MSFLLRQLTNKLTLTKATINNVAEPFKKSSVNFRFLFVLERSFSSEAVSEKRQQQDYRFTLNYGNNNVLNDEQRNFYEKNGYLIVKQLFSNDEIDKYHKRFIDIANGTVKPDPMLTLQRDVTVAKLKKELNEESLYKVQELYADEVLFEYCCHPTVLDYVEAFVGGPDIWAIHSMLINKPPDVGTKSSRHPLHQDLHYFPLRPADRIVATWTAMEKINKDNGCLSAIPGTHCGEHLPHDYPKWEGGVNKLYYGIVDLPQGLYEKRVHLNMERGDCVFFHPLLIHGSGINRTKGFRKAISCHYASAKNCHYIDVENTMQGQLADEILQIFRKKSKHFTSEPVIIDYKTLWKFRSRLVRGEEP